MPFQRSEEHTSELQSHSFISYAVFCLKKKVNAVDRAAIPQHAGHLRTYRRPRCGSGTDAWCELMDCCHYLVAAALSLFFFFLKKPPPPHFSLLPHHRLLLD